MHIPCSSFFLLLACSVINCLLGTRCEDFRRSRWVNMIILNTVAGWLSPTAPLSPSIASDDELHLHLVLVDNLQLKGNMDLVVARLVSFLQMRKDGLHCPRPACLVLRASNFFVSYLSWQKHAHYCHQGEVWLGKLSIKNNQINLIISYWHL